MIISKAPLRISLFGGGTDLPAFWKEEPGCVMSTAIDKYVYVITTKRNDDLIYLNMGEEQLVSHIRDIENDIVRECLFLTGVTSGITIIIKSDVTSNGSGLGASSSLTVALLHALFVFKNKKVRPARLAELACTLEIELLNKPIGKQDQYIASYGGFRTIRFLPTGEVQMNSTPFQQGHIEWLEERLLLFSTHIPRKSETILERQTKNTSSKRHFLRRMKAQVEESIPCIKQGSITSLGCLMKEGWDLKKSLADGISNPYIDQLLTRCLKAGAEGGKITGAGGGGHLLVISDPAHHDSVRDALSDLSEVPFRFETQGSTVHLVDDALEAFFVNHYKQKALLEVGN